jgi:hypothetical protein
MYVNWLQFYSELVVSVLSTSALSVISFTRFSGCVDDSGKEDSGKDDSGKEDSGKDDSGKDGFDLFLLYAPPTPPPIYTLFVKLELLPFKNALLLVLKKEIGVPSSYIFDKKILLEEYNLTHEISCFSHQVIDFCICSFFIESILS